jgi:hypothetical protein
LLPKFVNKTTENIHKNQGGEMKKIKLLFGVFFLLFGILSSKTLANSGS